MTADIGRYLFLACAVAGRRVSVHLTRGNDALAYSDGQSILLPPARAGADVWLDVVAQAALIGSGALVPHYLRRLVGRRDAARRYAYLEVLRATTVLADRLPSAFLMLPELRAAAQTRCAETSLEWALSRRVLPQPPAYCGTVRPLMGLRKAVSDEGVSALSRRQASGDVERRQVDAEDEQNTEESKLLRLFQNPLAGNSMLSDMLNKILGASAGKSGSDPSQSGGAEMPIGRIERVLRRGLHAVRALPFELPEIDARAESGATAYPEWDVHKQQYRPAWAVVEEVEPWRPDGARDVTAIVGPTPRELRRQLAGLGLDHEMHRRQFEGTELDTGRLLDCAIDFAAGQSPSALDVYRSSRRTRRDLAVAVALDISGSTGEADGNGASVFDRQMRVAYQLGRTLSELGDSVAVHGFHSWGRNLVRSVRLKGPEERWGAHVGERFAQLEPVGYTRTGAAIRHGVRALQKDMRLPNRLLVLITDGIAYDQDYEAAYAEGDAHKALEEARASGTACVCLCIGGSQEAEKLRAVFGTANLLIVDEPEQIVARIRQVCREALASVSRRRLGVDTRSRRGAVRGES
jgi:nitric oxide reductase NorD protein